MMLADKTQGSSPSRPRHHVADCGDRVHENVLDVPPRTWRVARSSGGTRVMSIVWVSFG